jgi:hypothetical protein
MQKYPILNSICGECDYIPYELMMEHENQCYYNHGQSVHRLAERGGTTYLETFDILNDKLNHWSVGKTKEQIADLELRARREVHAICYEWLIEKGIVKMDGD